MEAKSSTAQKVQIFISLKRQEAEVMRHDATKAWSAVLTEVAVVATDLMMMDAEDLGHERMIGTHPMAVLASL